MTLSLLIVPLSGHTNFKCIGCRRWLYCPDSRRILRTGRVNSASKYDYIVKSGLNTKLDIFGVVLTMF